MHHHRRHDGGERERAEPCPHHASVAGVTVNFRQDVAENIGNRKEQHAGQESHRTDDRQV